MSFPSLSCASSSFPFPLRRFPLTVFCLMCSALLYCRVLLHCAKQCFILCSYFCVVRCWSLLAVAFLGFAFAFPLLLFPVFPCVSLGFALLGVASLWSALLPLALRFFSLLS